MIRCKCGTWTDYGMTCVACRSETYRNMRPPASNDGEGGFESAVNEALDEEEEWDGSWEPEEEEEEEEE